MTWGALRGALGLFLAMLVKANPKINTETKEIVMFHAAMIALLTLGINGTTTGFLVSFLGLSNETETRHQFTSQFMVEVERKQQELLKEVRESRRGIFVPTGGPNFDKFKELIALDKSKK
jgi:NhaP-type Na+/H+ or K+/H+ antiporter